MLTDSENILTSQEVVSLKILFFFLFIYFQEQFLSVPKKEIKHHNYILFL